MKTGCEIWERFLGRLFMETLCKAYLSCVKYACQAILGPKKGAPVGARRGVLCRAAAGQQAEARRRVPALPSSCRRLDWRVGAGAFDLRRGHNLGDCEQLVALLEVDEADALGAATGFPDLGDAGADALALGCQQHHLVGVANAECAGDADRAILRQIDGDD